jgi:hypothetical protein
MMAADILPTVTRVDVELARQFLPEPHALALRLREAGADDRMIAVALEIDPEGVEGLVRIARQKLEAIATVDVPPGGQLERGPC